jgi:hypothetical protein
MAFPGFHSPCGSSFTGSFANTVHSSAAIPHDAADIHEVEAVSDGADGKAGPLLGRVNA